MEFVAAGLSTIMNVFLVGLFIAGVMKLFQIHTVLTEMKDALRRPSVAAPAPTPLHSLGSGDAMLRALDAQLHAETISTETAQEENLKNASPR